MRTLLAQNFLVLKDRTLSWTTCRCPSYSDLARSFDWSIFRRSCILLFSTFSTTLTAHVSALLAGTFTTSIGACAAPFLYQLAGPVPMTWSGFGAWPGHSLPTARARRTPSTGSCPGARCTAESAASRGANSTSTSRSGWATDMSTARCVKSSDPGRAPTRGRTATGARQGTRTAAEGTQSSNAPSDWSRIPRSVRAKRRSSDSKKQ